jgi:hypothetical protein
VKTRCITMPRENDLEGVQDQGGKHGGQKGMPKPEPRRTTRREPRRGDAPDQGIVRDESGDRSSRGTMSELSKSAEQIRSDDESGDRSFPGRPTLRRARLRCRNQKPKQHQTENCPIRTARAVSLACRPGCSLAYFQPCRVRLALFQACHSKYQAAAVRPKTWPPLPLYRPL